MFDRLQLQRTYADLLGSRLQLWRVQSYSPYRSNFRCGICGDSTKNKFRKRGYILEKNNYLIYHCHNSCGTIGFEKYLRDNHNDLYTMYRLDLIKNFNNQPENTREEEIEDLSLDKISHSHIELDSAITNKLAYGYLKERLIPEEYWGDIYYTNKFYEYINSVVKNKFPASYNEYIDRRIVFPLRDLDGEIFGVIGRAIDSNNKLRYITIRFNDNSPKLFGLNRINVDKIIYILEGPIDTFFIENSIAMAGTDAVISGVFNKEDVCIILDNQPRSPDVIQKYKKYINQGYKMVIWPGYIKAKDPNDMLRARELDIRGLNRHIIDHTYSGVRLEIEFNRWRKF